MIGLIFTTGAGEYFLTLFDTYGAMGLTLIALTEIISVMYIYGHAQFTDDIEEMTGIRPGWYWQICWRFIAPVLLTVILVSSIIVQALNTPTYIAWVGSEVNTIAYLFWICAFCIAKVFCEVTSTLELFHTFRVFHHSILGKSGKKAISTFCNRTGVLFGHRQRNSDICCCNLEV